MFLKIPQWFFTLKKLFITNTKRTHAGYKDQKYFRFILVEIQGTKNKKVHITQNYFKFLQSGCQIRLARVNPIRKCESD